MVGGDKMRNKEIYCTPEIDIQFLEMDVITASNGFGPGQELPDIELYRY